MSSVDWRHYQMMAGIFLATSSIYAANTDKVDDLSDLPLEELFKMQSMSAPRLRQKPSQSPSSVSILTARDICTFGWWTLVDALNGMRGLFTTN